MFSRTNFVHIPGSPLCSATPRQLWCAPDAPQSFASPLEAAQGIFSLFLFLLLQALLCFCFSFVEISASKRAESSQTYGGAVLCSAVPHCKAGTRWNCASSNESFKSWHFTSYFLWNTVIFGVANYHWSILPFSKCSLQAYWGLQLQEEAALNERDWAW